MTTIVASESLLAVDVGTTKTRAQLFDVIDGHYRFVAARSSETTLGYPFWDIREGVRKAIDELAAITGRVFFRRDGTLITPTALDNSGVDSFIVTMSAGEPIKIVAVGLVEEVSIESIHHLAASIYSNIVDTISLDDGRSEEARIDAIIKARPDLIIMAGGVDGGASNSIRKLLNAVGLSCYLLPQGYKPHVLFAGNNQVVEKVSDVLADISNFRVTNNLRPTLGIEQLGPAQSELIDIFGLIRKRQYRSLNEIEEWTNTRLIPTSIGLQRIICFLSEIYDPGKGVLGIDIGASSTTVVSSINGKTTLGVYPQLGLAQDPSAFLQPGSLKDISQLLPFELSEEYLRDYIYNKSIYPYSIPATPEDLSIDQAIAKQIMRCAMDMILKKFPDNVFQHSQHLLPFYEPIIASGGVLTKAPSHGQSMLMILDGLQPTGVSTILLDKNNLISSLGAAADVNPALVVQVLGSNSIVNLGPVIVPVGTAKRGTTILNSHISYEDGHKTSRETKFGSIDVLPLAHKEKATIRIQPLHRFDVGMGPGVGGSLRVVGGTLGVVIDARGRPLMHSYDTANRKEMMITWLQKLEKR